MSKIGQAILTGILLFIGLGSFGFGYYEDFNGPNIDTTKWNWSTDSSTITGGKLKFGKGSNESIYFTGNKIYTGGVDFDIKWYGQLNGSSMSYPGFGLKDKNGWGNYMFFQSVAYDYTHVYLTFPVGGEYTVTVTGGFLNQFHYFELKRTGTNYYWYIDNVLVRTYNSYGNFYGMTWYMQNYDARYSDDQFMWIDYIDDGSGPSGPYAYTGTFNFNYGKITNNVPINVKNYFNFNFQYNGSYSGDNTIKYKFGTGQSALGLYSPFQLIGNDNNFIIYLSGSQYYLWDKDNNLKRNFSNLKKEIKIDRNSTEGIMTFYTYFYEGDYNPLNIVYSSSYSSTLGPINDYDPGYDVGFIGCLDTDLTCQLYYYGNGNYAYLTGIDNITYELSGSYHICDFGVGGLTDYRYSSDNCITKSYKFDDLGIRLYWPFNDLECGGEIGYTFFKKDNTYVEPQSLFFHWQNSECRTTGTFIVDGSGNVQEVINPYYDGSGNVQSYNDDVFQGFTCDKNNDGDVSIGEGITCPWTVLQESYKAFVGGLSNIKKTITIASKVGSQIKTTGQLLTGYDSSLANSDKNIYKKVLENKNVKAYTDFILNILLAIYFLLLIYFLFG